jgi:hypothetical protein
VQTANNVIKAMENKGRVAIETALFDFPGWYEQVPVWIEDAELNAASIPVKGNYAPIETRDAIHEHKNEPYVDFQKRCANNVKTLLDRQKGKRPVFFVDIF